MRQLKRCKFLAVLLSPGEDVQFKLMLVMSELKECEPPIGPC